MTSDFDDEETQFMSYDDKDLVDMMEEPVAISRVRAYALAQDPRGRQSKVTLESARDKLDRVKATREKQLTKRKLETFLSDYVDAEFQEQSKVVNSKRFSVEKALAKLEAVKMTKEIAKTEVDRHVNTYVSPPPGRTSRTASEGKSIDEEIRVKATREKQLTKRKLETFLSDYVDAEFQEQSKVVNSKRFSVEKALAKLEAVKMTKEIAKTEVDRHVNTYVSPPPGRTSRTASEGKSIDVEIAHEGVWVRHAKVKLDAAREKKLKSSRKRSSRGLGSKKRNGQRKSTVPVSSVDGKNEEVDFDATSAPDTVRVAMECVLVKEASVKGKKHKVSKQRAVRVSERIANSRLRMQQGLPTSNVEAAICSKKVKVRRNKRKKPEEPSFKICPDSCPTEKETEAINLERDTESFLALPLDFTSSVEFTTPTKRRKIQQMLVGTSSLGTRLSAGVECIPPVSPYGLIQEHLYQDPWKVLVACMLLNKTGGRQMHKVIWDLFELCPDAETCVSTETEKIGRVIHSLGLQNKRAITLQRFSQDYMGTTWTNVTQLHGIGEYARDAYAIFCEGRWQDVQPNDIVLNKYWQWLSDTQGLGYGFSQIE